MAAAAGSCSDNLFLLSQVDPKILIRNLISPPQEEIEKRVAGAAKPALNGRDPLLSPSQPGSVNPPSHSSVPMTGPSASPIDGASPPFESPPPRDALFRPIPLLNPFPCIDEVLAHLKGSKINGLDLKEYLESLPEGRYVVARMSPNSPCFIAVKSKDHHYYGCRFAEKEFIEVETKTKEYFKDYLPIYPDPKGLPEEVQKGELCISEIMEKAPPKSYLVFQGIFGNSVIYKDEKGALFTHHLPSRNFEQASTQFIREYLIGYTEANNPIRISPYGEGPLPQFNI